MTTPTLAAAGVTLLGALVAIGGGLLLYALVRAERADRRVTSRRRAERLARRDTSDRDDR